jgi:hypothetical protein
VSEADLAKKVIAWLEEQHWDVYQEVVFKHQSARADIVAVRAGLVWVIETKTSLTLAVLEQASNWCAHLRSIAVPGCFSDGGGRGTAYGIARNYLKIGIIEVGGKRGYVCEVVDPPIMREYHNCAKRMRSQLKEEHKHYLAAGSNGGGYYTPYRETMEHVRRFIAAHPGCTLKQIMDDLKGLHHYASTASARSGVRTALSNWESDWCEVRMDGQKFTYYLKGNLRW